MENRRQAAGGLRQAELSREGKRQGRLASYARSVKSVKSVKIHLYAQRASRLERAPTN